MKQALRIVIVSALATAAVIKGVPALAEPTATEMNVSIVRTADLDLTNEVGRHVLDRRLVKAAGEVCGTVSSADLDGQNEARKCRRAVLGDARAQTAKMIAARTMPANILVAAR